MTLPGLGLPEIIILLVIGVLFCALPITVVALIVFLVRGQSTAQLTELQEENRRLRKQLDDRDGPS